MPNLPQYIVAEMRVLEDQQPDTYRFMQSGGFVVRRSAKHQFHCVPTDQVLKQTINREAKCAGGVIGFTLRKGALLRWIITRQATGQCSAAAELQYLCLYVSSY